ncbi:hypothetical protein RA25_02800 [Leisingera sp. ANG-S5]|nr:hypothetical protein RA25_02800 [Leisingera sp. ANG-S5]
MIPVPKTELEKEFEVQINFLRKSITEFDAGDYSEFRRLASTLRVLLHRTKMCVPAVDHIGLDDNDYISYATPLNERNLLTEHSLAMMQMSRNGTVFLPALDQTPTTPRRLSLDEWKEEPVLRDDKREVFNRWELVLIVANKLGSHIDHEVDEKYHRLVNENSIGWMQEGPKGESPVLDLEKVYIRHIAWEALISLEAKWIKILGNRGCTCESGKKARYCCMKS